MNNSLQSDLETVFRSLDEDSKQEWTKVYCYLFSKDVIREFKEYIINSAWDSTVYKTLQQVHGQKFTKEIFEKE